MGKDWVYQDPSLAAIAILDSGFNINRCLTVYYLDLLTLFAAFRCFRCFAALAFSILCRNRTGVRFDFGSDIR